VVTGTQFYENEVPNIMQNGGDYAKVKCVPPKPSSLWDENVGKIYSTWNPGLSRCPHIQIRKMKYG
jgi:hypothetical protein